MACNKNHSETDLIVKDLPISQGSFERHKCASCAYEKGLENGTQKLLNFDLQDFISNLEESQKGDRRHRSAIEAYTLGFFYGLNGNNKHLAIKEKSKIASQMRDFGLSMVAKGIVNATFSEHGEPYSHAMGLIQVANGFEILIKSKIVEEHPLLVFSKIPKEANLTDGSIKMEDLLEHGQTIMYSDLPDRLWATTGYKIDPLDLYNKFGRIRNQIIHFAVPSMSLSNITLEFAFKLIEKALNDWWDITIFDFTQDYNDVILDYIFDRLNELGLQTNYTVDVTGKLRKK